MFLGKGTHNVFSRSVHRGAWDSETLADHKVLTLLSGQRQRLNPGGVARNVTLPSVARHDEGYWFEVTNTASKAYDLTVKNAAGSTVATVKPGQCVLLRVDSAVAWIVARTLQEAGSVSQGAVTTVDMANAAHELVLAAAGSAETELTSNIVFVDPNGGAQDLTLPPEAEFVGALDIVNTANGAEAITVKNDAAGTIITLDQGESGRVFCDGTTWYGFVGAAT